MFEVFGPFARSTPSVFPIVLALWPLLGVVLALVDARHARVRAAIVCALGAVGGVIAFVATSQSMIVQHLGLAARIGQLDLVLALGVDPLGALASSVASVVAVVLVLQQTRARRVALTCATLCAVQLVALADGAALLVLAACAASLVAGALGYVHSAHFVADRIADCALVAAAALLFWTLGGSWVDGDYVPDLEPRLVVASRAPDAKAIPEDDDDDDDKPRTARQTTQRGARSALSLGGMPNAVVLVDGTWLRTGPNPREGHIIAAPFDDASIAAGPHTVRVRVGAGSDDYYVPRVDAPEGGRVQLAVRGATTTFREIEDDLAVHDAAGAAIGRDAIARRKFFGASAVSIVLALVAFAFAARSRLFPFGASLDDPPRALLAVAAVVAVARFPLGDVAPAAPWIACAFAAASILASARALRDGDVRALFAAELAIAGAGLVCGAPVFGALHGFAAALLFARGRAPSRGVAHIILLPTHIGVATACSTAPRVGIVIAAWMAACALGHVRSRLERAASRWVIGGFVACAAIAVGAFFVVPARLASSFRSSPLPETPSLALAGLLAAIVTFAWIASRTRALARLAKLPIILALAAIAPLPTRAARAMGAAIAAAIHELDARLAWLVGLADRGVRTTATLTAFAEDAVLASATRARIPLPSERATRVALAVIALLALASFTVPWLS